MDMAGKLTRYACPECGHQRTAERCWECDLRDEERSGFLEVATAAISTATLLPFIQAIATKAGEDIVPKIAGLVPRRLRHKLDESDVIELVARDRRLIIMIPKRLSAEAARQLSDIVNTLQGTDGWFRVTYDAAARSWDIASADDEGRQTERRPPTD